MGLLCALAQASAHNRPVVEGALRGAMNTERRAGSLTTEYVRRDGGCRSCTKMHEDARFRRFRAAKRATWCNVVRRHATWCNRFAKCAKRTHFHLGRRLRGRESECAARQERGAGRRTIGPQVPSPRSSLPDPLTSPLFPFPHSRRPSVKGGNARDIVLAGHAGV
jgi:hypothetical protein